MGIESRNEERELRREQVELLKEILRELQNEHFTSKVKRFFKLYFKK